MEGELGSKKRDSVFVPVSKCLCYTAVFPIVSQRNSRAAVVQSRISRDLLPHSFIRRASDRVCGVHR